MPKDEDYLRLKKNLKIIKQKVVPGFIIHELNKLEGEKYFIVLATSQKYIICKAVCRGGINLIKYFSLFELAKSYISSTRESINIIVNKKDDHYLEPYMTMFDLYFNEYMKQHSQK